MHVGMGALNQSQHHSQQTMVTEYSFVRVSDNITRRTATPIHISQPHRVHLYSHPAPASNYGKFHENILDSTCPA